MPSLAGELVTETLGYDAGRQVTVYVPPDPAEAVVFAADGGWHVTRPSRLSYRSAEADRFMAVMSRSGRPTLKGCWRTGDRTRPPWPRRHPPGTPGYR